MSEKFSKGDFVRFEFDCLQKSASQNARKTCQSNYFLQIFVALSSNVARHLSSERIVSRRLFLCTKLLALKIFVTVFTYFTLQIAAIVILHVNTNQIILQYYNT